MARITLRQLLDHAAENNYGMPAFNINNMEQVFSIMDAAKAVDAPVILQASRGARAYANDIMLEAMVSAAEKIYPEIPICLHQDHGNCLKVIRAILHINFVREVSKMARITLRQLLDHAAENNYGMPAFNINNMEQVFSIMDAAKAVDAPVILQASRGARAYANDIMLEAMVSAAEKIYPEIPICLHQDHGNDEATCLSAMQHSFTSVMMDGSLEADAKTPASYEYNVNITKAVTDMAHMIGVSVEGELGCLGSLETGKGEAEDGHGFEGALEMDQLLTDPDEAVDFVSKTKCDALAIAMGTSHGAYKFTKKPTGDVLDMGVVERIHAKMPNIHLVMHGSSSVPEELLDIINKFGGEMPETYGVPVEEILKGIKHGVRKVNIDTDLRLAATGEVRRYLEENKAGFDPRGFLKPAKKAMEKLCKDRYESFGSAGQASKIKVIPLGEMAKRYASGELDPRIATARAAE